MICHPCSTCGNDGPHHVAEDYDAYVLAICAACNHGFAVLLAAGREQRTDADQ